MPDRTRIEATRLTRVDIAEDGRRLCLQLQDQSGRSAAVSLPIDCLNTVLAAVPRQFEQSLVQRSAPAHRVDTWSLELTSDPQTLRLTLHMPDGVAAAFEIRSWQIEGMATLVRWANPARDADALVH